MAARSEGVNSLSVAVAMAAYRGVYWDGALRLERYDRLDDHRRSRELSRRLGSTTLPAVGNGPPRRRSGIAAEDPWSRADLVRNRHDSARGLSADESLSDLSPQSGSRLTVWSADFARDDLRCISKARGLPAQARSPPSSFSRRKSGRPRTCMESSRSRRADTSRSLPLRTSDRGEISPEHVRLANERRPHSDTRYDACIPGSRSEPHRRAWLFGRRGRQLAHGRARPRSCQSGRGLLPDHRFPTLVCGEALRLSERTLFALARWQLRVDPALPTTTISNPSSSWLRPCPWPSMSTPPFCSCMEHRRH